MKFISLLILAGLCLSSCASPPQPPKRLAYNEIIGTPLVKGLSLYIKTNTGELIKVDLDPLIGQTVKIRGKVTQSGDEKTIHGVGCDLLSGTK